MEKYIIEIKRAESYAEKSYVWEAEDGQRYGSKYSVPEGLKAAQVEFEAGAIGWNDRQVFRQEVDATDIDPTWLTKVIKAVNEIQ